MNFGEDRNLLFGVLAMQLRGVSPVQLAKCASAWSADRTRSLPGHLVEAGLLDQADCEFLNRLVDEAIRAHEGDVAATLADFGGAECVDRTFQGRIPYKGLGDSMLGTVAGVRLGELDESLRAVDETPGRYTGASEHARGGMGRVLLVYDEHLGREIAMKELLPYAPAEGETLTPRRQVMTVVSRFLQEARITGQLEHPSIVPVYELGRHRDGSLYYTMKLVRGRTLSDVVRSTGSLAERLALLPNYLDLCQAIAYAHIRGVIHRDIKPGNVMIGEFGETVVLDWGLAKSLHDTTEQPDDLANTLRALEFSSSVEALQTSHGQILGTPVYMPPEQARGELDAIDERSDVYSLGAVLYELLTGNRPYERGKPAEILQKVISQVPRPVLKVERTAPQELVAVCERAMARDQRDRYKDAKDLVADIERFQTGALVSVYRYSIGEYMRRWVRRHKGAAITAAAAAMLIVAITAVYVVNLKWANTLLAESRQEEQNQRIEAEGARDLAEQRQYVATILLASEYLDSRLMEQADQLLWTAPESLRNWEWGYLLGRCHQYVFSLPGCNSGAYTPDGLRIITLSVRDAMQMWDARTGSLLSAFLDPNPDRYTVMKLSPDGSTLAVGEVSGSVKIWHVDSRELVRSLGPGTDDITEISFSPDGQRLVTTARDGSYELWDLPAALRIGRLPANTGTWPAQFTSDGSLICTSHPDNIVRVWSQEFEALPFTLDGNKPLFRPGTHELVLVRENNAVAYDGDTGQEIGTLVTRPSLIRSVQFNSDGSQLIVAGSDGVSIVRDIRTGITRATLEHGPPVVDATFSPDSSLALTFSDDGLFKVWELPAGAEIARLVGHARPVARAEFSPQNTHFISMGHDHEVHVWNARSQLGDVTIADMGEQIRSMSVAVSSPRISIAADRSLVHVMDRGTGRGVAAFGSAAAFPYPVSAISPDGTLVATATDGISALIWRVDDQSIFTRIDDSSSHVNEILFSPDSTRLAIGYTDGRVSTFDATSTEEVTRIDGHTDEITALAYLPDGSRLVTASADGTAAIWDPATGTRIHLLTGHSDGVLAVAISPDGSEVLTSSSDRTIWAWDRASGEGRQILTSPTPAYLIAYMGDSGRICTQSQNTPGVRIWKRDLGQELTSIAGEAHGLVSMHYDGSAGALITAESRGIVRMRDAAPWRPNLLPGSSTQAWQDRYSEYRESNGARQAVLHPYTHALRYDVAAPRPYVVNALRRIIEFAGSSPGTPDPSTAFVLASGLAEKLQPMGVRTGDVLIAINDNPIGAPATIDALEALQQDVEQSSTPEVRISISRAGFPATIVHHALDIVDIRDSVELPAARLLEIVTRLNAQLLDKRTGVLQTDGDIRYRLGGLAEGGSEGVGLSVQTNAELTLEHILSDVHLQPDDRILSIDSVPISSVDIVEKSFAGIADRIRSGGTAHVEMVLMRGMFKRIALTIRGV